MLSGNLHDALGHRHILREHKKKILQIAMCQSKSLQQQKEHQILNENFRFARSAKKKEEIKNKKNNINNENKKILGGLFRFCDTEDIRKNIEPPQNYDKIKTKIMYSKMRDRKMVIDNIHENN